MKIKIYSKQQPKNLKELNSLTVEQYTIENGLKSDSCWLSEITTDNYHATKAILEQQGYTAQPASSQEITTQEYSIFHMGGN